jgi:hypothetical protein
MESGRLYPGLPLDLTCAIPGQEEAKGQSPRGSSCRGRAASGDWRGPRTREVPSASSDVANRHPNRPAGSRLLSPVLPNAQDMAILMTLEVPADSDKLVQYSKDNPDALLKILERAKTHGVISHKFFASGGDVLVVDEWPDENSFQAFFADSPEIQDVMAAAGATAPPEITFWTKLDTGDEV